MVKAHLPTCPHDEVGLEVGPEVGLEAGLKVRLEVGVEVGVEKAREAHVAAITTDQAADVHANQKAAICDHVMETHFLESLERKGPTGLLLHAIGKVGSVAGIRSSHSAINRRTGDTVHHTASPDRFEELQASVAGENRFGLIDLRAGKDNDWTQNRVIGLWLCQKQVDSSKLKNLAKMQAAGIGKPDSETYVGVEMRGRIK
ncbi:hypothetical protein KIN20_001783 [Parelaphostrongylus tenuis]|uniref:Uncharacterized protein n=1 Tax=Parelaphostrongylus tenuis TaxID=148309 RepID=A0AAD5MFJ7_PARTN|nr:hypothetical protein KIN20_001783 [Parelaphostrongylus tenuis]